MRLTAALVPILGLLTSRPAFSDIMTVVPTLDVNAIEPGFDGFTGGAQGSPPFGPPFSVTLAAGDTFDFTIRFLPGQELTVSYPIEILVLAFTSDQPSYVVSTSTLSLLDSDGTPFYTSNTKTDTLGMSAFGDVFNASDLPNLPPSVAFAGLRYVGTLDQYLNPSVTVRRYTTPAFYYLEGVAPTPEPSSLLLLSSACLVAAGGVLRRKLSASRSSHGT